ncbi:hypothetical protein [Georgenia faecalis]|uniref:Uncharacterized protein n=1 Tax=Georgenia faecalis TaxID=2483799 RepID=A0ABV9D692_9MICO|nr:hypothetical protein [Georgenia faecalis]
MSAPAGKAVRVVPRARLAGLALATVAVVVAMAWLRFDAANIALAVAGVLVVGVVLLAQDAGHAMMWPRIVDADRGGYRHEVSQLSWAFTGKDGRITETGFRRLRDVAREHLALAGLDLDADADAVRELLGAGPYATLHPPRGQLPHPRGVDACLAALERLGTDPRSTP